MSRRLTREELDEQFEQFLKESVSDDSIDFGNATRSSILDTLGDAEKKQIKKKDSKPWWNNDDHDDDDSSGKEPQKRRFTKLKKGRDVPQSEAVTSAGEHKENCSEHSPRVPLNPNPKPCSKALDKLKKLEQFHQAKKEVHLNAEGESSDSDSQGSADGILATGRSFLKSQRSSQTIEEVDEEEQRETSPGQPSDNVAVSISRDSLEPEDSVMASGPGPSAVGFGMDTLDEEEEKERFFANLERGASSTIDYSKLNKELDSTGSTVIATLRNNEKPALENEENKEEKEDSLPKSTHMSADYSEDFEEDAGGREDQEIVLRPASSDHCEKEKHDQGSKKIGMLAKVSLLDSQESKHSTGSEKDDGIMKVVSYGQSASEIEALQEAYRKINHSLGDTDVEQKPLMSESGKNKSSFLHTLENTRDTTQNVTTESDMPTVEELMKPIGRETRGFELQPVSDIGQRFGRLDELSSKNSLEEQRKFSEEERALNYFSEGQNCKKRHGFPRACGEAVDDGDKRIANEVDNLMQYVSKAKIVPRHSSLVDTDGKIHKDSELSSMLGGGETVDTGRKTPSKTTKSPQSKMKKTFGDTSVAVKSSGYGKGGLSTKQLLPVGDKKTVNKHPQKMGPKGQLPAEKATSKLKGGMSQTQTFNSTMTKCGLKMDSGLFASVHSFAGYLQQQIDRSIKGAGQIQDHMIESSGNAIEELPKHNNSPNHAGNIQREISLLQRAEEAHERLSTEHNLVEKLKAELQQKERELQHRDEELRLKHEKEVFELKQENYIIQTKENEKLYRQTKALQAINKQNEELMFKENHRLMTELAFMKEQMTKSNLQQTVGHDGEMSRNQTFTELLVQLRAAQKEEAKLMEEVRRLKQDKQSLEVDLVHMQKERDLAKAQVIHTSGDKTFEMKIMEDQYKQEICGLKKRLQWYAENQDLLDKDTQRLIAASTEIQKLKDQVEKLKTEVIDRNVQQQRKFKERVGDAKRIQDLERQVKEMEDIIRRRHPNSLPALIFAAASATSGEGDASSKSDTVSFLEKRITRLEADLEGKDEEAKKSLRAMEQQYQKIKIKYEQRISELEQLLSSKLMNEHDKPHQYATKAKALQEEITLLKEVYKTNERTLKSEIDTLQKQLAEEQKKTSEEYGKSPQKTEKFVEGTQYKVRIEKLNHELAAKNKEIQELLKTIDRLQKERRTLLSGQTAAEKARESRLKPSKGNIKDNVPIPDTKVVGDIQPFPASLDEKCYQPLAFTGSHISEVLQENEKLKLDMEQLKLEMNQQRLKLQASAAQTECEARRAREEAAEHISALKGEHQKKLERILTHQALEHSSSKVAELTSKISTQEIMIKYLRDQVGELQRTKEALAVVQVREETLQTQMVRQLEELKEAKETRTPELKHFLALDRKIKNIEMRQAQREQELQQQTRYIVDEEKLQEAEKWKRLAQLRTRELETFRVELDSILNVLRELQKQGVVIPAPSAVGTNF
ncbi:centrosomal protein of 162 kDa isoform X3 [Acipenser ruthenus]|uniref:centrosomal protein of 162 kDa isoform X3 n=1 Tax=Acipenser ruthenus TaxID=7906 RepID=UPI002741B259|nr:centrosomal protein of 162 kDa isoform X3 [Acipenser ruthenus]